MDYHFISKCSCEMDVSFSNISYKNLFYVIFKRFPTYIDKYVNYNITNLMDLKKKCGILWYT